MPTIISQSRKQVDIQCKGGYHVSLEGEDKDKAGPEDSSQGSEYKVAILTLVTTTGMRMLSPMHFSIATTNFYRILAGFMGFTSRANGNLCFSIKKTLGHLFG